MQLAVLLDTCVNRHMATKDLIKALRDALGFSQESFARRCGVARVEITKLETGKNKATSYDMRENLARGCGLTVADIKAYLEGDELLNVIVARANPPPDPGQEQSKSQTVVESPVCSALENDLKREMFKLAIADSSFSPTDVDLAGKVFRSTHQYVSGQIDLIKTARKLLESARDDRLKGGPGAAQSVMARSFYVVTDASRISDQEHAAENTVTHEADAAAVDELASKIAKNTRLKGSKIKPKRIR